MTCDILNPSCPDDALAPGNAPGPICCEEVLVRIVRDVNWFEWQDNQIVLTTLAIPEDDIKGRNGRTLSVFRKNHTDPMGLEATARSRTIHQPWQSDPVIAHVATRTLRNLSDASGSRLVTVYADPRT